jgi:hypothetical protein
MEPSDPTDPPWGHWEMPYAIQSMGSCPYPVAQRQPVLSSPGMREGEEGLDDEDDVVDVAVAEEDNEPIEVIPVPDSTPPQQAYKQTAQIRIGPRGRPTKTLALRMSAREASLNSPETISVVWPPPPPPPPSRPVTTAPPPPSSGTSSTALPPQDPATVSEEPPLQSPIGGRILHRFAHLMKPSRPGHRPVLGTFSTGLEGHGGRGGIGGGVEWRGVTPVRHAGEVDRGRGDDDGNRWIFPEEVAAHKREGQGRLGLNPNTATPLYPSVLTGPGQSSLFKALGHRGRPQSLAQ